MLIPITQGRFLEIDEADAPRLAGRKIHAQIDRHGKAYAALTVDGKKTLVHIYLMQPAPGMDVDHRDGDGLNCKRDNMRECTRLQNNQNKPCYKNSRSGYKGVSRHGSGWRVRIYLHSKPIRVHGFETPEAAALEYNRLAAEMFGEFARLNIVEQSANNR